MNRPATPAWLGIVCLAAIVIALLMTVLLTAEPRTVVDCGRASLVIEGEQSGLSEQDLIGLCAEELR